MTTIDIVEFIDQRKVGRFQIWVLLLCVLMLMFDGFDDRSIGFVVPAVATAWGVAKSEFGPVFSAGLLGAAIGALLFGVLADRFGRKAIMIFCLGFFGLFTLAMAWAHSVTSLLLLKFVSGLGVGGFMPNGFAMLSEFAPLRRRGLMVTLGGCGYSLGTVAPGVVAAKLFAVYGWQTMFYIGGVIPLLAVPIMMVQLPESARFLIQFPGQEARLIRVLKRIDPGFVAGPELRLVSSEIRAKGVTVAQLLTRGRAASTLLLWFAAFMDLSIIYYLGSWLPAVLSNAGYSPENSAITTSIYLAGGVIGAPIIGRLSDRFGIIRVLSTGYLLAATFILVFAAVVGGPLALMFCLGLGIGTFVLGGHYGVIALAGQLYPTFMRSTGVGWALGVGRFCSFLSPMVGGLLIAWQWTPAAILSAVAGPAALAAIAVFLIRTVNAGQAAGAAAAQDEMAAASGLAIPRVGKASS